MTSRKLTFHEVNLGRRVFADAIDYDRVNIHHRKYFVMQPKNSAIAPNGEIFIHGPAKFDYGRANGATQAFFIHEMTHVWQYQNKILNPILSALGNFVIHRFNYERSYCYDFEQSKDLVDYRMEQQAQIIEDYVRIRFFALSPTPGYLGFSGTEQMRDQHYDLVLHKFLSDPNYVKTLR